MEVEEINGSADCVVYTLTNLTVHPRADHPEDENVPLYDEAHNKYLFYISWQVSTNTTSHNWSYVDTDHNNLITEGDRFILYDYSSYGGVKGSFVLSPYAYTGFIKGEIPPSSDGTG